MSNTSSLNPHAYTNCSTNINFINRLAVFLEPTSEYNRFLNCFSTLTDALAYGYENDSRQSETNQHQSDRVEFDQNITVIKKNFRGNR